MTLNLPVHLQNEINAHLREAYPNEGAGLLLGSENNGSKQVSRIILFENKFAADEQRTRYLITAEDMLQGEIQSEDYQMDVVGIFHSHPDHPAVPSEYDREYALPWYTYLIVSVQQGNPAAARCWRLAEDRSHFNEEKLTVMPSTGPLRPSKVKS